MCCGCQNDIEQVSVQFWGQFAAQFVQIPSNFRATHTVESPCSHCGVRIDCTLRSCSELHMRLIAARLIHVAQASVCGGRSDALTFSLQR